MNAYIEIDRAQTPKRTCDKCRDIIPIGSKYLHMNKNKHRFILCGKCLYIFAAKIMKDNPLVKADATVELLGEE